MFNDLADVLVWVIRVALLGGLAWGAWLCIAHIFFPSRSEKTLEIEHFAAFAVLILLLTTLGSALHAGA
jgi:hypothetical protein